MKTGEFDKHAEWHLDAPFWRSKHIFGESLFFIRQSAGELPCARLLFPPVGPLQLTSASREVEFASPGDFLVNAETGIVTLPAGSRIPFMERADLYPKMGQEHCMDHKRDEEGVGLFFSEGHLFHDRQAEASYEHRSEWRGFVPRPQPDRLPATAAMLNAAGPLKICIVGDSISAGCNASALAGVPPRMPAYPELATEAIRRRRTGKVVLENFAVSGTGMKYGLGVAEAVWKEEPNLVIIAYGMNDVGFISSEEYLRHVTGILDVIKRRETEVILVASMPGNPEWNITPAEKFPAFRDALASLCGAGVALADMTSLWSDLLKLKSYQDLTGNGVNHPNDFGHRIYAQVLLEVLGLNQGASMQPT